MALGRHLVPLLASVALAGGAAILLHGLLRGDAAPVPEDVEPDAPPERRARAALLAWLRGAGYQADETESAGFIDLLGAESPMDTFEERRFAFIAREASATHRDAFLLRARIAPNGVPVAKGRVWNLTRTADGDEAWLTPRPGQVAFTTRFGGLYTGVTVLDLNGAAPAPGASLEALLTRALTDLIETGDWRGQQVARFVLAEPSVDLRLSWEGDELVVARKEDEGWAEARLDLGDLHQLRPPAVPWLRAVETHRAARSLLSWAVDTARSVSFIGPERIYALETAFFRLADLAQTARYRLFGGVPASALPEAAVAVETAPPPESAGLDDPLGAWPLERPPEPLTPRLDPPLPGEGVWQPFEFSPRLRGAPPIFWRTMLRVDPERPDAITELVLADPRQVSLHMVGGTEHPRSTTGEVGTGMVPAVDRDRTLAAFNGGFQAVHGGYGMVVDRTVLLPPLPQVATVATYTDGLTLLGTWLERDGLPAGLASLRQNLPPLCDLGQFNPLGRRTWGFTLKGSDPIFTWRTGLGVTRAGHLIFAVCVRCSADTLADALIAADTEYALHLDMNISNIGWEWWRPGRAAGEIERRSLMVDMWHSEEPRYLEPHPRDFFYLLQKPAYDLPPGEPLTAPLSGDAIPRPAGVWPPPVARGASGAVRIVRLDSEALGATEGGAGGWCRLSIHRGVTGEDLPHRDSGTPVLPDRATLEVGADGRLRLLPPGRAPSAGRFFQQLPAVMVDGQIRASAVAGPERWVLGADRAGVLWLLGGAVATEALLATARRLRLGLVAAPAPSGGAPMLVCGAEILIAGPPTTSAHTLSLGRAFTPPLWPLARTTDFPDRR